SPYRVNCEITSSPPPASARSRFIFPSSSGKSRRPTTLSAIHSTSAAVSVGAKPTRSTKPVSIDPTTDPAIVTDPELTRCNRTRIGSPPCGRGRYHRAFAPALRVPREIAAFPSPEHAMLRSTLLVLLCVTSPLTAQVEVTLRVAAGQDGAHATAAAVIDAPRLRAGAGLEPALAAALRRGDWRIAVGVGRRTADLALRGEGSGILTVDALRAVTVGG